MFRRAQGNSCAPHQQMSFSPAKTPVIFHFPPLWNFIFNFRVWASECSHRPEFILTRACFFYLGRSPGCWFNLKLDKTKLRAWNWDANSDQALFISRARARAVSARRCLPAKWKIPLTLRWQVKHTKWAFSAARGQHQILKMLPQQQCVCVRALSVDAMFCVYTRSERRMHTAKVVARCIVMDLAWSFFLPHNIMRARVRLTEK